MRDRLLRTIRQSMASWREGPMTRDSLSVHIAEGIRSAVLEGELSLSELGVNERELTYEKEIQ